MRAAKWLVAIVAVGACIGPGHAQDTANVARAKQDVRSIITALNLFRLEHARVPTNDEGLAALVGRHLREKPMDPWGRPYLYATPGRAGDFDVYTLGADGREGGEGENVDIGPWSFPPRR